MFFHLTETQWHVLKEVSDQKEGTLFWGQEAKAAGSMLRRGFICLIVKNRPWDGYKLTPAGKSLLAALDHLVNLKDSAAPAPGGRHHRS
jgi:hypothetical protein